MTDAWLPLGHKLRVQGQEHSEVSGGVFDAAFRGTNFSVEEFGFPFYGAEVASGILFDERLC